MHDDIPEAIRSSVRDSKSPKQPFFILILAGVALAGAIALGFLFLRFPKAETAASLGDAPTTKPLGGSTESPSPSPGTNASDADQILGHFAYREAPPDELEPINADGQIKLRRSAAAAYQRMVEAAAAEGITLVPISGFRSESDQTDLFFRVKEERNQAVSQRAEVSAPPGHSEHHTGYAIDLGDAASPETNLSQEFEKTAAFTWLSNNAARFSFELSFPQGNPQGVSYEPWHWRFVGDRNSLETFYRARKATSRSSP